MPVSSAQDEQKPPAEPPTSARDRPVDEQEESLPSLTITAASSTCGAQHPILADDDVLSATWGTNDCESPNDCEPSISGETTSPEMFRPEIVSTTSRSSEPRREHQAEDAPPGQHPALTALQTQARLMERAVQNLVNSTDRSGTSRDTTASSSKGFSTGGLGSRPASDVFLDAFQKVVEENFLKSLWKELARTEERVEAVVLSCAEGDDGRRSSGAVNCSLVTTAVHDAGRGDVDVRGRG